MIDQISQDMQKHRSQNLREVKQLNDKLNTFKTYLMVLLGVEDPLNIENWHKFPHLPPPKDFSVPKWITIWNVAEEEIFNNRILAYSHQIDDMLKNLPRLYRIKEIL